MTDRPVSHFLDAAEDTGVRDRRDEGELIDPAWLAMRRTMITASEVAPLLGEGRGSPLSLFVSKMTERSDGDEPRDIYDPRVWGELEQPILRIAARWLGWKTQRGGHLLRSRKHRDIGATLDAEIDRGDEYGWIPYEGKCRQFPRGWDEELDEIPTEVLCQVQTQLLVTGAPVAQVFALVRGACPVQVQVDASPELHAVIVEHVEWFMDLLRRAEPPDPDGSESSRRALTRLYPDGDGTIVALPPDAVDWTREYLELTAKMAELDRRKGELSNLLRKHIGPATHGILPEPVDGKTCWRWQVNKAGARTLLALKKPPENLRLLPPPHVPTLTEELEVAVEHAQVTRLNRKRRKARR